MGRYEDILDYCNAVLARAADIQTKRLQSAQNSVAHGTWNARSWTSWRHHTISVGHHWLPVCQQVCFTMLSLHGSACMALQLLQEFALRPSGKRSTSSKTVRSAATADVYESRSFAFIGPSCGKSAICSLTTVCHWTRWPEIKNVSFRLVSVTSTVRLHWCAVVCVILSTSTKYSRLKKVWSGLKLTETVNSIVNSDLLRVVADSQLNAYAFYCMFLCF